MIINKILKAIDEEGNDTCADGIESDANTEGLSKADCYFEGKKQAKEVIKKLQAKEQLAEPAGIIRSIDDLGRIVIPKEIRRSLRITYGTPLEILPVEGGIFIKIVATEKDLIKLLLDAEKETEDTYSILGTEKADLIKSYIKKAKKLLDEGKKY